MRVVSLCPSNTDIVFALNRERSLVGVDRWSLKDASIAGALAAAGREVADVGTDLHADIDTITGLNPDIVLASLSVPGMEANIEALEEKGLPYVIIDSTGLAGVTRGIAQVAAALDADESGRSLIASFESTVDEVRQRADAARIRLKEEGGKAELPRLAAWEWWPKPVIVAGRPSWIHDVFKILGVENAFADLEKESSPVETDTVLSRSPDTVCVCWCGSGESRMNLADIVGRAGWSELPAVKNRRIFLLPERLFGRPGPHLARGLKELYELFYGDRPGAARRLAAMAHLAPSAMDWPG